MDDDRILELQRDRHGTADGVREELERHGRPLHEAARPEGPIRAARGAARTARSWDAEAAKRMLMNNLDPEVAVDWRNLVVYGGSGRAARNWREYHRIVAALERLAPDETLCVQSGAPVYVARTSEQAPRVLIANSNLVPRWANQATFDALDRAGLTMYGQMTAGSWIYIGTQGILQGTYQTFLSLAERHFGAPTLRGKLVVTGGLGGMSGAQPLAVTMNEGVALCVEVRAERVRRKVEERYLDRMTTSLDEALTWVDEAVRAGRALSIGLVGNVVAVLRELVRRDVVPDVVTDQTSAHDLGAYLPEGELGELDALRVTDLSEYHRRARETAGHHVEAILALAQRGAIAFDYGNNLRAQAESAGVRARDEAGAWRYPGFVPAYIRPLFARGLGPFRWAALSGDPADIHALDDEALRLFPEDAGLARWIRLARERVPFLGLPTRICWLGYGDRARFGEAMNRLVADGRVSAPVAIGRDHLDCGSVASPDRETEAMRDGSDAIADWPLLNFALNIAAGASWVSFHHGGGVGIGNSLHAGMVVVADGTSARAERLQRVLTVDPGIGVVRHAIAGYAEARETVAHHGIDLP
ncbi:MAG: urocanate hydratase [Polyangiaceae bacterium]|nr:urocanate hydratase [Polyangiaceae bacterium]